MKQFIFFLVCTMQSCYSQIPRSTIVQAYKKIFKIPDTFYKKKPVQQHLLLYAVAVGINTFTKKTSPPVFLIKLMEQEIANDIPNTIFYYQSLGPYAYIQIGRKEIVNALYNTSTKPSAQEQILDNFAIHLLRHSTRIKNMHEDLSIWIARPLLRAAIKSCIRDKSFERFGTYVAYEIGKTALLKIPALILEKTHFYQMYDDLFSKKC